MIRTTRRRFLAGAGAAATATTVAGCSVQIGTSGGVAAVAPGDGSELWTKDLGGVTAGPVLANGTVYVTFEGTLYALSPGDGSERWTVELDIGSFPEIYRPTVVGDTVLAPVGNVLVALSASDGSEKWRFSVGGDKGVWYGPSVAEGTVVAGAGETDVYGLSLSDGNKRWEFTGERLVHHSGNVANGTVYLGSEAGRLTALSLSDGSERWTFETEKAVGGTPAVGAGTVFFGTKERRLYAVSASDGSETWSVDTSGGAMNVSAGGFPEPTFVEGYLVVIANTVLHSVDVDSRETWGENVHGGFELDVAGGTVYVGANLSDSNPDGGVDEFGQVYAYDLATGNERWATFVDGQGVQPPAVGSDTVYAGQQNGKLHALARSDGSSRWVYEGDKPVEARPVVAGNAVIFETG